MSVTIQGVKGYEYQYKATLLLSLLHFEEQISLFVEHPGGEDASITIKRSGETIRLELQVKRESNTIDIDKLVDWLVHFKERQASSNLLQRIYENKNSFAVFVTQSRCADSISSLASKIEAIQPNSRVKISDEFLKDFFEKLGSKKLGDTRLLIKREAFCKEQSIALNQKKDFKEIFERILIVEKISDEDIDYRINSLLNKKFNVSQAKTENLYLHLLEIIKEGRNSQSEITHEISIEIKKNKINRPVINDLYTPRENESTLIDALENTGVLLLTGLSLCGKSETAKQIATRYFDNGFDYKISSNIDDIKYFITENSNINTIAILEDPWGHIDLNEDSTNIKIKLSELVRDKQINNKLIITCRTEVLIQAFNCDSINDCRIHYYPWNNLTILNGLWLKHAWESLTRDKTFPEKISTLVINGINSSNDDHLLQIGQLKHLIHSDEDISKIKTFEEVEYIARMDAREISKSILQKNANSARLIAILALCANTTILISYQDLFFIETLLNDTNSIIDKTMFSFHIGAIDLKENNFPSYKTTYQMTLDIENSLQYLEERNFIKIINSEIIFTHPNYHEAGRELFFSKSTIKQEKFIKHLEWAVCCLAGKNALFAASQLELIYKRINPNFKKSIIDISIKALDSIFPSVEDTCLILLINHIGDIEDIDKREKVFNKIQRGATDSYNVLWDSKKEPFIATNTSFLIFSKLSQSVIVDYKNKACAGHVLSAHEAWCYLTSLRKNAPPPPLVIKALFQRPESFIRKKLVSYIFYLLLSLHDDEVILSVASAALDDAHPDVASESIQSLLQDWNNHSNSIRNTFLEKIKNALSRKDVSIRSFRFLSSVDSDDTYPSEHKIALTTKDSWNIWCELFIIAATNLPKNLRINSALLDDTISNAMKFLNVESGINLLSILVYRTKSLIEARLPCDEFDLSISNHLLSLTKENYLARKELFYILLEEQNTDFLLSSLKWIILSWGYLHESERNKIVNIIHSDRVDARWIHASILTSSSPPGELIYEIIGINNLSIENISLMLTKADNQLLFDCLSMYSGSPGRLWYLGLHHRNKNFWQAVIKIILKNENHKCFNICLNEFINPFVNGFYHDEIFDINLWGEICSRSNDKDNLLVALIYNIARCSCDSNNCKELWEVIFNCYKNNEQEDEAIAIIECNLELLQRTGDKEDIIEIFGKDFILKKIYPKIIPDCIFIEFFYAKKTLTLSNNDLDKIISTFEEIIHIRSIRFFLTFDILNALAKSSENEIIRDFINNIPNTISDESEKFFADFNMKFEYSLQNWIE